MPCITHTKRDSAHRETVHAQQQHTYTKGRER